MRNINFTFHAEQRCMERRITKRQCVQILHFGAHFPTGRKNRVEVVWIGYILIARKIKNGFEIITVWRA